MVHTSRQLTKGLLDSMSQNITLYVSYIISTLWKLSVYRHFQLQTVDNSRGEIENTRKEGAKVAGISRLLWFGTCPTVKMTKEGRKSLRLPRQFCQGTLQHRQQRVSSLATPNRRRKLGSVTFRLSSGIISQSVGILSLKRRWSPCRLTWTCCACL